MDITDTKKNSRESFEKLPQALKEAVLSVANFELLMQIDKTFKLTDDQSQQLGSETGRVLMGLTRPEQFVKSLQERLKIDVQTAQKIDQEINGQIFQPVQNELRALYAIPNASAQPPQTKPSTLNPAPSLKPQALHSSITPPPPPKPKTLSAELSESAGLKPPPPPAPPKPNRPLDAELSERFRKPEDAASHTPQAIPPVPPPPPRPRPIPAFETPPNEKIETRGAGYREETKIPSAPVARPSGQSAPSQQKPFAPPPLKPADIKSAPPLTEQAPQKAPSVSQKPYVFENTFGEEKEEDLSREEILRGIENPASAQRPASQTFSAPLPEPPKQYDKDPYREPTW